MIAWSAGVSAAAAGMAALFADGKTPFDRAVFASFSVVGAVTFLVLLGAAIPASWLRFPGHRRHRAGSGGDSPCSADSREAGVLVQKNVARDGGSVFAAQNGDVIVHESGPGHPVSPPGSDGDPPGHVP